MARDLAIGLKWALDLNYGFWFVFAGSNRRLDCRWIFDLGPNGSSSSPVIFDSVSLCYL